MAKVHEAARAAGIPFEREAEPRQREFNSDAMTLRYLDWGNEGAPRVLLLHGFAQTAHSWDFVALALCNDYHVISMDTRGHGDSDWAPDGDYSPVAHQRDLDRLLDHLGSGQLALVGLSMGGRNSYVFASRRPAHVRALVIVDSGPVGQRRGARRIRNFVSLPDQLDSYEQFVERVHGYNSRRSIQQVRDTLIYNVRQRPDGMWIWKYDPVLRDPDRPRPGISADESWAHLRSIRCPTLLVRGARSDVLARSTADEMVAAMTDCTLVEVDNAGHLVPGDNPRDFIAFLKPWLDSAHAGART